MAFATPFFSKAGQKERLGNVGSTLKAAVTGKGVTANTPSQTANKVLGAAASNPFSTAFVGAVAAGPKVALGAARAAYTALPTAGKVGVALATPVAIGAAVTNPNLVGKAATAPRQLSEFGSGVGLLIQEPSYENLKQVAKESPIISAAVVTGTGLALGKGVSSTLATIANTRAVKENTAVASPKEIALPAMVESPTVSQSGAMVPFTRETQVLGKEVRTGGVRKKRKVAKKAPQSNNVRVNVLNQQTFISRR